MRVKILKDNGTLHKGQIVNLPKKEALKLVLSGKAIFSKDFADADMRVK